MAGSGPEEAAGCGLGAPTPGHALSRLVITVSGKCPCAAAQATRSQLAVCAVAMTTPRRDKATVARSVKRTANTGDARRPSSTETRRAQCRATRTSASRWQVHLRHRREAWPPRPGVAGSGRQSPPAPRSARPERATTAKAKGRPRGSGGRARPSAVHAKPALRVWVAVASAAAAKTSSSATM